MQSVMISRKPCSLGLGARSPSSARLEIARRGVLFCPYGLRMNIEVYARADFIRSDRTPPEKLPETTGTPIFSHREHAGAQKIDHCSILSPRNREYLCPGRNAIPFERDPTRFRAESTRSIGFVIGSFLSRWQCCELTANARVSVKKN